MIQPNPQPHLPDGVRALLSNSRISLSIGLLTAPDCPLIAINEPFTTMTGYSAQDVLGKNCRFLQPAGGAGPVRNRMRDFVDDDAKRQAKFIVPNARRNGEPFLNLVYMSKLTRDGRPELILGSQFDISRYKPDALEIYEQALREDIRQLRFEARESGMVLLGTYDQLASSHSMIAQLRLDE